MAEFEIRCGDALEELKKMSDESVQCVVTSPPYWGLCDYQTESQVWGGNLVCQHQWGNELPNPMKPYENQVQQTKYTNDSSAQGQNAKAGSFCSLCSAWRGSLGLEPTPSLYVDHLVTIFRELRRVLRGDGTVWLNLGDSYAGSWSGNSMRPSGGSQREGGPGFQPLDERVPARSGVVPPGLKPKDLVGIPWRTAFALQADGWWLRSDIIWAKTNCLPESVQDRPTKSHEYIFLLTKSERYFYDNGAIKEPVTCYRQRGTADYQHVPGGGDNSGLGKWSKEGKNSSGRRMIENVQKARDEGADHDSPFGEFRNKRSVWTISTQPYPEAHFATFPEALVTPCVLAGSKPGDLILDLFAGSGTTGVVALRYHRNFIGIDLNPKYCQMAEGRIKNDQPLYNQQML